MYGLVIYSDGGSKQNPGTAGSGLHGYLFEYKKPKQGAGHNKVKLSQVGYVLKEEKLSEYKEDMSQDEIESTFGDTTRPFEVTPIQYLDGYQSFGQVQTNNYAELQGLIQGLNLARALAPEYQKDLKTICLFTDSEYVVKGVNQYLEKWSNNNYRKADGSPIANEECWVEISMLLRQLTDVGYQVFVNWIKGHEGHLGNERADKFASIGCNISENVGLLTSNGEACFHWSDAKGYWKGLDEKPDLLCNRYVLFNPAEQKILGSQEPVFFTCHTSEELRFLGQRQADTGFALIRFKEDFNSVLLMKLHDVMVRQSQLLDYLPVLSVLDSDVLLSKDCYETLEFGGTKALTVGQDYRHELFTPGRTATRRAVTQVMHPPYLSFRVFDFAEQMTDKLNRYLSRQDKQILETDITDLFYETVETKKGKVTELKKDMKVGIGRLPVKVSYDTLLGEGDAQDIQEAMVVLVFGQDLPDRNTLKRLESKNVKIKLLTFPESPHIFSYATYLECDDGTAFMASLFSNLRLISTKKST